MSLIELRTNPSKRELAWFGLLLLLFLGIIGFVVWRATGSPSAPRYIWGIGVVLAAVYYAVPPVRRPIFAGWMYAAYPIGWLVSHALLALIYFGLLTPIGKLLALVGYDSMERRFDRTAVSYWIQRESHTETPRYFRQF